MTPYNNQCTMKTVILILGIFIAVAATAQDSVNFQLKVQQFENELGTLKVAIYNNAGDYLNSTYRLAETPINDVQEVTMLFKGIPEGLYAISIYHDENDNGEMDTNIMGIPTEDYAFSNNAPSRFGPASYEDAVFEVTKDDNTHIIKLN